MRIKTVFLFTAMLTLGGLLSACGSRSLASTDFPGLTVQGGKAYLAAGTYVYRVDLSTGQEETTVNADGKTVPVRFPMDSTASGPFYGDPILTSNGQMIIGSANINDRKHPLFSANADNFATNWSYQNQAKDIWLAGALVLNDMIYAPNSDGGLYSFDLNGTMKGKFSADNEALWSTPVTDGQTIYAASMDHYVYAVNPQNLNKIWAKELDASITASPVVSDGKLYVATLGGAVYALKADTGEILWQKKFDGGVSDRVTLAGDRLYFGTVYQDKGNVYALNAADGSTAWQFDAGSSVTASPLVKGNLVVFVTEAGSVRALDLDGKPQWQQTIGAKLYTTPVDAGDLILVAPMGKSDLMLVAYDTSGAQKWVFAAK